MSLGIAIILSVIVMGAMIAVGRKVQTATKFVYPKDIVSIALVLSCILCAACAYLEWIPISISDAYWCFPIALGYFIGYMLGNEQSYQVIEYISPYARYTAILRIVIYEKDDKQYIADQDNRALLKRLLFGIVHELDTQGHKLEFDWTVNAKLKFKLKEYKAVNIELLETKTERSGKLKLKRYKTIIKLASAHQISHAQLITSLDAVDTLNESVLTLSNEVARLNSTVPRRVAEQIISLTRPSYEKVTIQSITEYLNSVNDKKSEGASQ